MIAWQDWMVSAYEMLMYIGLTLTMVGIIGILVEFVRFRRK